MQTRAAILLIATAMGCAGACSAILGIDDRNLEGGQGGAATNTATGTSGGKGASSGGQSSVATTATMAQGSTGGFGGAPMVSTSGPGAGGNGGEMVASSNGVTSSAGSMTSSSTGVMVSTSTATSTSISAVSSTVSSGGTSTVSATVSSTISSAVSSTGISSSSGCTGCGSGCDNPPICYEAGGCMCSSCYYPPAIPGTSCGPSLCCDGQGNCNQTCANPVGSTGSVFSTSSGTPNTSVGTSGCATVQCKGTCDVTSDCSSVTPPACTQAPASCVSKTCCFQQDEMNSGACPSMMCCGAFCM